MGWPTGICPCIPRSPCSAIRAVCRPNLQVHEAHWCMMLQAVKVAKASKAPRCTARLASSMELVQLDFKPLLQSPGDAWNGPCR